MMRHRALADRACTYSLSGAWDSTYADPFAWRIEILERTRSPLSVFPEKQGWRHHRSTNELTHTMKNRALDDARSVHSSA